MRSIIANGIALALAAALAAPASAGNGMDDHGRDDHGQDHHRQEHRRHEPRVLLTFGSMYGVDGPFVGSDAIRGVEGDETPWEVGSARGFLTTSGHLVINAKGIVFANEPNVPPEIIGTNDEAEFRGMVSCLTESDTGIQTVNVATKGFPATTTGNSLIDDKLDLPNPCVAPIVFVLAGSEDKWFAVTGFEHESN